MRCPDCNHNQRYRDGTRCGKCSYQFVFRKKSDGLSDHALRQIIRRLSDNGQYAFTLTQLTLELCRYWQRSATQLLVSGLIFVAIISGFVGFFFGSWSIALLLGIILVIFSVWKTQQQRISLPLSKARKLLDRYQQSHPITASVSYTHLDVYKRQWPVRSTGWVVGDESGDRVFPGLFPSP